MLCDVNPWCLILWTFLCFCFICEALKAAVVCLVKILGSSVPSKVSSLKQIHMFSQLSEGHSMMMIPLLKHPVSGACSLQCCLGRYNWL